MVLSNVAILRAIEQGRLGIEPRPELGGDPSPYNSTAVDLTLGPLLQIPRPGMAVTIDFRSGADIPRTLAALSDTHDMRTDMDFKLEPRVLVLGQTNEVVHLPLPDQLPSDLTDRRCLAARVEGKSSRARFGLLVHFTAPTVHAGWYGRITLEIMNLGPAPILLYPGMAICQLILETVEDEPFANRSIFHNQRTPAGES